MYIYIYIYIYIHTYILTCTYLYITRWSGVPFILSCGKALDEKLVDIRVQFKPVSGNLFADKWVYKCYTMFRCVHSNTMHTYRDADKCSSSSQNEENRICECTHTHAYIYILWSQTYFCFVCVCVIYGMQGTFVCICSSHHKFSMQVPFEAMKDWSIMQGLKHHARTEASYTYSCARMHRCLCYMLRLLRIQDTTETLSKLWRNEVSYTWSCARMHIYTYYRMRDCV
jgi:hypothetical protein